MELFHTIEEIRHLLTGIRKESKTIGFVPTMGALHEGHLDLVRRAGEENQCVVVSIFVNPIQFNNPEDLQKYPRTLETDIEKLGKTCCSIVFAPSVEEMYPTPDTTQFDFGNLDKVMEGSFRPGHFRGVGIIVKKFFEIIEPDKSYFGEKDFQQLTIIKRLTSLFNLPIQIVACPTIRESDGLAMSSRNERLTTEEREVAPILYETLSWVKDNYSWFTPVGIGKTVVGKIEQNPMFRVEYAQVVNTTTLEQIIEWDASDHAVLCIAVFLGQVRLIDNIQLY